MPSPGLPDHQLDVGIAFAPGEDPLNLLSAYSSYRQASISLVEG